MARAKKRKGRSGKGTQSDRHVEVHLVPTVELIHEHITEAMCEEVFRGVRINERQRKWSLFALARFWLAVIVEAPSSLSQLLERTRRSEPQGFLPEVDASAEAFFQKCKGFSSAFFLGLYQSFIERILAVAPQTYCQEVAFLRNRFSEIVAIDGSRLDKIAHRLKITWSEKAAILPGCVTAVYDLFRGIPTQLWFDPDAAASEFKRALVPIECLREGALAIGDRLYCSIQLFHALNEKGCFGLFRRNKTVGIKKVRLLSKQKVDGHTVEDWLVRAGGDKSSLQLRLVRLKRGRSTHEALTNVLDPKRLSARAVVSLYPLRWRVERLFHQLKCVLGLNRFYAANPNAVGMQVYAAAIVHAAFRVAQANVATQLELPPEELSPQKLFPHLALVSIKVVEAEFIFDVTCKVNPGVKLRKPSWRDLPGTVVSLRRLRVQRRSPNRKKPEYSPERRKWKSITKIDGSDDLT